MTDTEEALTANVARNVMQLIASAGKPMYRQAAEMGIDRSTLVSTRAGRHLPSTPVLCRMADYWGVQVSELIGGI